MVDSVETVPTRRDFCRTACQAALAAAALGQIACGGGDSPTGPSGGSNAPPLTAVNANIVNGVVTLNVDGTPLASAGGAALVNSTAGSFLVVRTDATTVSALTAQCTHQQCTISGYASPNFVCPCHGSRFAATGAVVNGPATQALRRFTATLTSNVLTIA
jgi:Rieske Fe-S protein